MCHSWQVIAAAGSVEKCQLALQRGAWACIDYSQESVKEAVRTLVGSSGVHVAIDTVGGDICLDALRRYGIVSGTGRGLALVPHVLQFYPLSSLDASAPTSSQVVAAED